jgi:hypothetical protein
VKSRDLLCLLQLICTLAIVNSVYASDDSQRIVVNGGTTTCPGAQFSRIQDAINAASPGQTIEVCAGLYNETLQIANSLSLKLDSGALLMPTSISQSTVSLASGNPIAAIITVRNAAEVNIEGGVIDAGASGISQCAPNLMGIVYQNSSGTVKRTWVRNTQLVSRLSGCQSGDGIFIQSGNGGTSRVTVTENRVEGYQKNGITANEVGTQVEISLNIVVGAGPTTGAAQNGIQIGFGAQGSIEQNFVTGNIWSPCSSPDQCVFLATGILIEQSDNITIEDNSVGNNQVNIFLRGDGIKVRKNNRLFGSVVLDNIQVAGNSAEIESNQIYNSARAAVGVSGNDARIRKNIITNAQIGILKSANVSSIDIGKNDYDDVDILFVDPSPVLTTPGTTHPER